ncbi:MAG: LysM domain-containing protein [Halofilum sp. (in: g-proteobacteria)]|nr:LysM domain-containing protein [Halofilum sp. (in: g-proteobacteria)]
MGAVHAAAAEAGDASPATPQRLVLMGGLRRLGPPASAVDDAGFVDATAPEDAEPAPAHDLSADPSDYAVGDDGTIEVQAAETLGHYAEWLDLRASQLRRVNDMRYGTPVVIGKRLELDFSRVEPATFEERRLQYHEELQGRFFEQFRITGTERELVQRGDSLWTLARRSDNVPVWLLRQYNPDLDFSALRPGMPVTLPVVERQAQGGDEAGSTRAEADGAATGA